MIQPKQNFGQKVSNVANTAGAVVGGLNLVKDLFTNRKKRAKEEDERQLKQQGRLQQLQIGGSKELADYEQELKMKMWNDTNYGAQLAQAEAAGVSKAAAIGGSGTGTQGASVGGTTGGQAADAAQTESAAIQRQMAQAQIANMMANTKKTIEEAKNIAGVDRKGGELQNIGLGYKNEISNATVNAEITRIQHESENELEKLQQERNKTWISNETYKEQANQIKTEATLRSIEVKAKQKGIELTDAQIESIDEVIKQGWKTIEIKGWEAGIKEMEANIKAQSPTIGNVIGGELRRTINGLNNMTGAGDSNYYRFKNKNKK